MKPHPLSYWLPFTDMTVSDLLTETGMWMGLTLKHVELLNTFDGVIRLKVADREQVTGVRVNALTELAWTHPYQETRHAVRVRVTVLDGSVRWFGLTVGWVDEPNRPDLALPLSPPQLIPELLKRERVADGGRPLTSTCTKTDATVIADVRDLIRHSDRRLPVVLLTGSGGLFARTAAQALTGAGHVFSVPDDDARQQLHDLGVDGDLGRQAVHAARAGQDRMEIVYVPGRGRLAGERQRVAWAVARHADVREPDAVAGARAQLKK